MEAAYENSRTEKYNTLNKKKKFKVASHRQISRIINCELKKGNII